LILTPTREALLLSSDQPTPSARNIALGGRGVTRQALGLASKVLEIDAWRTGREAEIGRLTVAPDRQGQGLRSRLLIAVEDQLPPVLPELWIEPQSQKVYNAEVGRGRRVTPILPGRTLGLLQVPDLLGYAHLPGHTWCG
jgi:GNAT superfamily N-acetyltransferase